MSFGQFNLKISYNEKLNIQLFIRSVMNFNKFQRHWILSAGYYREVQQKIHKSFIAFLNQGDIYRIKSPNYSVKWRQKNLQYNFSDYIQCLNTKNQNPLQTSKEKFNIKNQIQRIITIQKVQQYNQICVLTIFLSQDLPVSDYQNVLLFLSKLKQSHLLINLFLPEKYVNKFIVHKSWIRICPLHRLKIQLQGIFNELNKIFFKKVTLTLKSQQNQMTLMESQNNRKKSQWVNQKDNLVNSINFPICNIPYILSLDILNLSQQQFCQFELELKYEDESGIQGEQNKRFSLRLKRGLYGIKSQNEFLNSTIQSENIMQQNIYNKLSLNFENVELNQKLNFIRIFGVPARVMLKSKSSV